MRTNFTKHLGNQTSTDTNLKKKNTIPTYITIGLNFYKNTF